MKDGLNGFTTLRTRPTGTPVAPKAKRICTKCGHAMSDYQTGDVCFRCEDKAHDAALTVALAKAAAEYPNRAAIKRPYKPKTERGVRMAGGIKLVPEELPGRCIQNKGSRWPAVIGEFIASGMECARLEVPEHKNASSTYAQIRAALGDEKRCYPCVRGESCYLVRVKK